MTSTHLFLHCFYLLATGVGRGEPADSRLFLKEGINVAKRYGVPYGMSKNRIARRLIDFLPPAEVFVDLMAGGCAVAHAALESRKYNHVIINDINPLPTQLFVDAVAGKYRDERRVIDKKTFRALRNFDPYVKYCWSFGSVGNDYLWSNDVMSTKLAACRMIFAEDDGAPFVAAYKDLTGQNFSPELLEYIMEPEDWQTRRARYARACRKNDNLYRLEALERLENLVALQGLKNFERFALDYREVPIPDGAVVYCDIPYEGEKATRDMCGDLFDYAAFYDWAAGRDNVFISSFDLPDALFEGIRGWNRCQTMRSVDNSTKVLEKLFIPRVA